MKNILTLLALPILAAGLTVAQSDPKATATDGKNPSATEPAVQDPTIPRREPVRAENDRDYGWIGLLGLVGLAGLRRRRENVHDVRREGTTTFPASRDREDIRRAG